MLEFLRSFVAFNFYIYLLLGVLAFAFLRWMIIAQRDRSRSIFTLERESANAAIMRSFIGLVIVLGLIGGVYYLSLITPDIAPEAESTPTPTPLVVLPDTPTPPPLLPTLTPTPTTTATPTPVLFEEVPTTQEPPTPAPVQSSAPASCPSPNAQIFVPNSGASIDGVIQIRGVATVDNFDYYKFEVRPVGAPNWNFAVRYDDDVEEGVLGEWNSDTVSPGEYEFQLVVVDMSGNFPTPCVIRLNVQ